MALEAMATPFAADAGAYPVTIASKDGVHRLVWAPLWSALIEDLVRGTQRGVIAARFHNGLVSGLVEITEYDRF